MFLSLLHDLYLIIVTLDLNEVSDKKLTDIWTTLLDDRTLT